jgi:hypothetical protein
MLSGAQPAVTVHHALLASDLTPLAQKRDDAVHGRHGNAVLLLLDLEPAQVVDGSSVW